MANSDIRKKTVTGVIWKFSERIGAQLVSLVVSIILARLLTPSDYSVVSVVTIYFTFANVLISGGLNTALIQKKDPDVEDYSTVLHVSTLLSVVLYVILFFTAPYIAELYRNDTLTLIIRVMGLSLPITAIKSIWCAYISSNLLFKKFFFATLGGTVASAVVGIALALNGAGAWALVAQQMTNTVIDTVILIATTRIRIVPRISLKKFKSLFGYGWKVLVSSLIGTVYNELVPMIIGVKYTDNDLSFYTKGRSFPSLISTTTTNTFSSVLFPSLSKYQNDKKQLLSYTRRFIRLSAFITFPLMLGLAAVSDTFIKVVLTEKWLSASPYIKIFSVACMFDVIHVGNCETVKAMGRSDIYLIMELIKKTGYFITIAVFLFFTNTPQTLALAFLVCSLIAIIVNSVPNRRLIDYTVKNQLYDLLPSLISAVIMYFSVIAVGKIEINAILSLLLQIATGGIVYILLSILIRNESLLYIFRSLASRGKHEKQKEKSEQNKN